MEPWLRVHTHYRSLVRGLGPGTLGLLGLALVSAGCSAPNARPQAARAAEAVPVTVAVVLQKTVPVDLQAIGNVEAYSTVSIKSQVEGQVERVYFAEGQEVKKGDLLFSIDARPFQAALAQAQANLAKDLAQAKHAQAEAERNKKLVDGGIVSPDQYEQFQTNSDALDAAVRADRAAVENAKVQLDYCTIQAPVDGRTGSLLVHAGNVVKANDIALVVMNQISPIYVSFSVPEKYLSEIKRRMSSERLKVDAAIPGEEKRPSQGDLSFVDNAVDVATGTIRLKGVFANQHRRLWPGQFVNVRLTLAAEPNALVVPSEAVQTGQQGQYVFVVKPDSTVEFRPVTIGRAEGGETVVDRGLRRGETVVTDGQLRLVQGAKVEVKSS